MLENENTIRLTAFFACLVIMLIWENIAPRRQARSSRWPRRFNNLAMILVTTALVRFLIPILAVINFSLLAAENHWGLFNHIDLSPGLEIFASVILLDLYIYAQHVLTHHVELLWRFHRVHHSDKDLDVTSGIRFHPVEIIFSLIMKAIMVILLGAPLEAVLIFELILNIAPMFNHSNIYLPEKLDHLLRFFMVTPDMHRIHHSIYKQETNSNYGFNTSLWDRIFGTYTAEPRNGQLNMEIGLDDIPETESVSLHRMLIQPLYKIEKNQTETSS